MNQPRPVLRANPNRDSTGSMPLGNGGNGGNGWDIFFAWHVSAGERAKAVQKIDPRRKTITT